MVFDICRALEKIVQLVAQCETNKSGQISVTANLIAVTDTHIAVMPSHDSRHTAILLPLPVNG